MKKLLTVTAATILLATGLAIAAKKAGPTQKNPDGGVVFPKHH